MAKRRRDRRRRTVDRAEVTVTVVRVTSKRFLQLRWRCPITGKQRQRSAGTNVTREAERAAVALEDELASGAENIDRIGWRQFKTRYAKEGLIEKSPATARIWRAACKNIESVLEFKRPSDLSTSKLSFWKSKMLQSELSPSTAKSYMKSMSAALGWAERIRLISEAPYVPLPTIKEDGKFMRSRPIVAEEFDRILEAAKKVRPRDFPAWQRLLSGLWHSGLRISEIMALSWDSSAELSIDTTHELPLVKILPKGQKNRRAQYQPITRQFWELLAETPEPERKGLCFLVPNRWGRQMGCTSAVTVIGEMGKRAGVITDPQTNKMATSHDIGRRAFTVRLGGKLSQSELSKFMRHGSTETTSKYYFHVDAIELAKRGWDA